MRRRICKSCGIEFQGKGVQRLCPACRLEVKRANVVLPRTCKQCGAVFDGGPRAMYCPSCREERVKAQQVEAHRRMAAGKTRPLGSTDLCAMCGKPYTVNSGLQRYCPDCAPEAIRQAALPRARARALEHLEENIRRRKALKENSAVCAYCGKPFTPTLPSVTCSEDCAKEYARLVQGQADYRRGRRKTPPTHERYNSGLPQSDVPGVTYHRRAGKWQLKHKGKYIGLFASREEAEQRKKELDNHG